ncbi:MAG TPA: phage terminase large subunit family protein [Alphaproteobacteria bacterium]|nr:phage terminase large subunit family protein [Alphaproteobacteria bacterium]
MLSAESSAEPGPWRTERTPYLKEIMEVLSLDHPVTTVDLQKGSQLGGTEVGNNLAGYVMGHNPCPMLMVEPKEGLMKKVSKQRLTPMIRASGQLRGRVYKDNVEEKHFPGGMLLLTTARSASGLRSMPIRVVFLDEVDAYPHDVQGEGDPLALAERRTATYGTRKKIFRCSTPTIKGESRIEAGFEAGDQRRYFVPCPHCQHMQWITWEHIQWEEGRPETAHFECEACGEAAWDRHKTKMLADGQWRPTNPDADPRHRSYHLSSLYSPVGWYSWSDAARDWLAAQGDPEKLKTFINTVLGRTWEVRGEAPKWTIIYERRESYQPGVVPEQALLLTAGVDVQDDRLEAQLVGWGPGLEGWSVDYKIFEGDPYASSVWHDLAELVTHRWRHESGGWVELASMAIDSGYATEEVYKWASTQPADKVLVIKGDDNAQSILARHSSVKNYPLRLWSIGVSAAKSQLYGWLRQVPDYEADDPAEMYPPGYQHFPEYGEEFFKQITAEERISRVVRGYKRWQWQKIRKRNEALDTWVYARAAASAPPVGIERFTEDTWARLRARIEDSKTNRRPARQRSGGGRDRRESSYL